MLSAWSVSTNVAVLHRAQSCSLIGGETARSRCPPATPQASYFVLALWREAITLQHGGDQSRTSNNISLAPKHGTQRAYTLSRLKREALA